MPELPEAETMARALTAFAAGRAIADVQVAYRPIVASDPDRFRDILIGREVAAASRLGKWIALKLSGGAALLVHLKMTGQFEIGPWPLTPGGKWPPHAHAAIMFADSGPALFYVDTRKFGRLRAFEAEALEEFVTKMDVAPDPLQIDAESFHSRLAAGRTKLKAALLDQSRISGLGNIYADESLFHARLDPHMRCSDLKSEQSTRLWESSRKILSEAIELRGSTVNNYRSFGEAGAYQDRHQVYGRGGEPCPVCGTILARSKVANRTTVSCPACQK